MRESLPWSRDELLVVFRHYCRVPYGQFSGTNVDIIRLAALIGRSPGAVTMKAGNFASLDPTHQDRGVGGLRNSSSADRELWHEFEVDSERVAAEAEEAYERLTTQALEPVAGQTTDEVAPSVEPAEALLLPEGPTDVEQVVRVRRVQSFFRAAVLTSYRQTCAISGLAVPELLTASHIIPWRENTARRADPRNGISLNALYDRAFDRGLIAFDEALRVLVSPRLRHDDPPPLHRAALLAIAGQPLHAPCRFSPDPDALQWHRENVFQAV